MKLAEIDTETLLTYYKNAAATYNGALGHKKADRNYAAWNAYAEELRRRGETVPSIYDVAVSDGGRFNGPGSA